METEEERRARLENDASTKRLRFAMGMDEDRKARLDKMVATSTAHVRPDLKVWSVWVCFCPSNPF